MRLYVASSWRNPRISEVVAELRAVDHEVYDFREDEAFGWHEVDPDWKAWTSEQFRRKLDHPAAIRGFRRDWGELQFAEGVVLVLPSGRSSHLEAGWALGAGKPTAILLAPGEPELMYKMADCLCLTIEEVLAYFKGDRKIEAGDSVHHYPSGEDWFILGVSRERNTVCVAGWPASMADLSRCALKEKGNGLTREELEYRDRTFFGGWEATKIKEEAPA